MFLPFCDRYLRKNFMTIINAILEINYLKKNYIIKFGEKYKRHLIKEHFHCIKPTSNYQQKENKIAWQVCSKTRSRPNW